MQHKKHNSSVLVYQLQTDYMKNIYMCPTFWGFFKLNNTGTYHLQSIVQLLLPWYCHCMSNPVAQRCYYIHNDCCFAPNDEHVCFYKEQLNIFTSQATQLQIEEIFLRTIYLGEATEQLVVADKSRETPTAVRYQQRARLTSPFNLTLWHFMAPIAHL